MITIVIPTIGRPTLDNAIDSVIAEGMECIVVNDGMPEMPPPLPRKGLAYYCLGRNYGHLDNHMWFGYIAWDTGVRFSTTEFTGTLGDDDEISCGSGSVIRAKIRGFPDTDLWIPGLRYNDGSVVCMDPDRMECGNVSHVIYRSTVLAKQPTYHMSAGDAHVYDFLHARLCAQAGYRVRWIGTPCIHIRPTLSGKFGGGR